MSAPVLAPLAAEVYKDLEPLAREDAGHDHALAHLTAALCAPLEDVWAWTQGDEHGPGMSVFLDPDRCPAVALAWLARLRGARIERGTPEGVARQMVKDAAGFARGQPAAIVAAAQSTLTGARIVTLVERAGGDAWALTVRTRTAETPDAAATLAAMLAVKPGGIVLTHVVSDDPVWDEATLTWDAVGGTRTWDNVAAGDV